MTEAQSPAQPTIPTKKPWQSKTLILGIISALAPLYPPLGAWITANPEMWGLALTGVFSAIRLITHGKVTIS